MIITPCSYLTRNRVFIFLPDFLADGSYFAVMVAVAEAE